MLDDDGRLELRGVGAGGGELAAAALVRAPGVTLLESMGMKERVGLPTLEAEFPERLRVCRACALDGRGGVASIGGGGGGAGFGMAAKVRDCAWRSGRGALAPGAGSTLLCLCTYIPSCVAPCAGFLRVVVFVLVLFTCT